MDSVPCARRVRAHGTGTMGDGLFGVSLFWIVSSSCRAAAEGNSLSLAPAARASSLAREPWGRIAGVARTDYKLSAEKFSQLHGSFNTRLPREGAAERLRELPLNPRRVHLCCGKLPVRGAERLVSSSCRAAAEGNSLRRCGASSLAREPWGRMAGVARWDKKTFGRSFFPFTWIFSIPGSLARELPRG